MVTIKLNIGFYTDVSPNEELRKASRSFKKSINEMENAFSLDNGVYLALNDYWEQANKD